jgi:transcription elongation factor S-II
MEFIIGMKVVRIQLKLEEIIECGSADHQAINLLKTLRALPMNRDILTETDIKATVNAIRAKSSDDQVIRVVDQLTTEWKKWKAGTFSGKEDSTSSEKPSLKEKDQSSSSRITESVRQKSREMLCRAIKGDGTPVEKAGDPQYLAEMLEECIYQEFRSADKKYASTIRSKIFNLRDAQNPELRLSFLCGQTSPQSLAKMTSTDMASVDLKAMREKWTKEAINEAQSGTIEGTKIDAL